jgi:hypothetical protein
MTKKRRGRRPLPPGVKKEKLVQTRVPGVLDETLREQARKNRVSVSQLIRNVLEDTFNLVENAVSEAAALGQTVKRDAKRLAATATGQRRKTSAPIEEPVWFEAVYAWQDVVLNREAGCAMCKRLIERGDHGLIGLEPGGAKPRYTLCPTCAATL